MKFSLHEREARLFIAACVLTFLFLSSFLTGKHETKTVTSALLNPAHVPGITKIILENPQDSERAELVKTQYFWLFQKNGISAPVPLQYVEDLLGNARKLRKMSTISDKTSNFAAYSLDDASAFSLSFVQGETIISKLFFGAGDYTQRLIAVRSASNPVMYWVENDLALTGVSEFWADLRLVPLFMTGNPESFSRSIQNITLTAAQTSVAFPESNYPALASLRSARLTHSHRPQTAIEALLHIEFSDGAVLELEISPLPQDESHNTQEYLVIPSFIKTGARYSREDFDELHYALVISAWTLNRILELAE